MSTLSMNALASLIRAEIEEAGPIRFSRFMELALYHPALGYYENRRPVGRHGDYYTSVSAGGLFGELLAFTFDEWRVAANGQPLQIVEGGAHEGRLANDILEWCRDWGNKSEVEYWILEPSGARQAWQRDTLAAWHPHVHWAQGWDDLPASAGPRIIVANELLDAMPVERWGWDATARDWFEWGVGAARDRFVWVRLGPARPTGEPGAARGPHPLGDRFPLDADLLAVLPDGFTVEMSPSALRWWQAAAQSLNRGCLLTFDYGLTDEELLSPSRAGGTLRAYRGHQVSEAVLDQPGEQDLTAHVHFSALRRVGEAAGLDTVRFETQGEFLMRVVGTIERTPGRFPAWTPARRRQLQTLVHPNYLGRAFRVLVQSRLEQQPARGS